MTRLRKIPRRVLVVLVGLALGASVGAVPVRGAEEDLRQRVLALNELTGEQALKGKVLSLLEKPEEAKKLLAAGLQLAKEKPQPLKPNAMLALATVAEELKDYDAGAAFYRLYANHSIQLLSGQGLSVAYVGLIRMLYNGKKYAEAEQVCRNFLEIDGDENIDRLKPRVLQQMIMAMALQGEITQAVEILDRLIKRQPDNWLTLELKAKVLRQAGKVDDAIKVYEEVMDRIKGDKRLKKEDQEEVLDEMRYALSGLYIERNDVDKAAEQLKTLLAHDKDNPTYNNDLGYIWADHDMNLAESEKLIRKALEEDRRQRLKANPDLKEEQYKDSAAFLDSLGWVLFKQKKLKEAKPLLLQAVQDEEGRHIEIYDHLGDVHMALGEKAEALAAWKKGLGVAGTSPREKQRKAAVEKKIKDNK
jgi:tetratricopeptide (TPR) repeat protein